jgi:hypothetical protein
MSAGARLATATYIIQEVNGAKRVAYDVARKPGRPIEWERGAHVGLRNVSNMSSSARSSARSS